MFKLLDLRHEQNITDDGIQIKMHENIEPKNQKQLTEEYPARLYQNQLDDPEVYAAYVNMLEGYL